MSKAKSLFDQIQQWEDDRALLDPILKEARQDREEIKALAKTNTTLAESLTFANGCFEAAYIEGWCEAIAEGDIERIRDLWERRIIFGFQRVADAVPKI